MRQRRHLSRFASWQALTALFVLVACGREAYPTDVTRLTFVLVPPAGCEDEARALVGRRLELTGTSTRLAESGLPYRTSGIIRADLTVVCVVDPERELEQFFGWSMNSENLLAPFVISPSWTYNARPGERARVMVNLVHGVDVHGRVVDTDDAPVAGEFVSVETPAARPNWPQWRQVRGTTTDDRGQFELTALAMPIDVIRVGSYDVLRLELRGDPLRAALASPEDLVLRLPIASTSPSEDSRR